VLGLRFRLGGGFRFRLAFARRLRLRRRHGGHTAGLAGGWMLLGRDVDPASRAPGRLGTGRWRRRRIRHRGARLLVGLKLGRLEGASAVRGRTGLHSRVRWGGGGVLRERLLLRDQLLERLRERRRLRLGGGRLAGRRLARGNLFHRRRLRLAPERLRLHQPGRLLAADPGRVHVNGAGE
jgi:hypothetical protein